MSNLPGNEVYSHTMSNGVVFNIREIPGFGDRAEIGFFIKDKCIGTFVVDRKRSGNIDVKPTMMHQQKIGNNNDKEDIIDGSIQAPSLSDIADSEDE